MIYNCDVLENGVFGESGTSRVSELNKREYWRDTLVPDVSCTHRIVVTGWGLIIEAGGGCSCTRIVH